MPHLLHRSTGHKRQVTSRIHFLGTIGFRPRRRWLRPFTVRVFRIERISPVERSR